MNISKAQQQMRDRYFGGAYGQFVSGCLWLLAASLATWGDPKYAIMVVVFGGVLIFPLTEGLVRLTKNPTSLSPTNGLRWLGMQVAFVLPLSMPLLLPTTNHRLTLFFPALAILLGAHYVPFVFLYGMRVYAALAGTLISGGIVIAIKFPESFSAGGWFTCVVLFAFSAILAVQMKWPGRLNRDELSGDRTSR